MSFPGIHIADHKISIYWMASCLAGHIIGSSLWAVGPFSYAMLKHPVMPCSNFQLCHAHTFNYAMLKHSVMPCSDIRAALLLPCCLVTAAAFMCRRCLGPFGLQLHDMHRGASDQKGQLHTSVYTPPPPRTLGMVAEAHQVTSVLQARLVSKLPVDMKHLSLYGIACFMWFSHMQLAHS